MSRKDSGQVVQNRRELGQRLHAGIPRLLVHRCHQGTSRQALVLLHPVIGNGDLVGEGRSIQDLRHQRIWIKGDWRHQALQLLRGRWLALADHSARLEAAAVGVVAEALETPSRQVTPGPARVKTRTTLIKSDIPCLAN